MLLSSRRVEREQNLSHLGCLKDCCLSWGDSPRRWGCWQSGRRPPPCPDGPAAICAVTPAGRCHSALNCPSPPLIQTGGGGGEPLEVIQCLEKSSCGINDIGRTWVTDERSFDKTQNGHISAQQGSERSQSIGSSELDEAIILWFHVCRTKKKRELEQLLTKWRERERDNYGDNWRLLFSRTETTWTTCLSASLGSCDTHVKRLSSLTAEVSLT